jgi:hypothetical protein
VRWAGGGISKLAGSVGKTLPARAGGALGTLRREGRGGLVKILGTNGSHAVAIVISYGASGQPFPRLGPVLVELHVCPPGCGPSLSRWN